MTDKTIFVGVLICVVVFALSAVILVVALVNGFLEEAGVPVEQEIRLVAILPSPQIVQLDALGKSERLSVWGYYSDRSVGNLEDDLGTTVSYTSSDPSVAQVDSDGVVTGIEVGGADIVVSYGSLGATVSVFVWGPPIDIPTYDPDRVLEDADDGSAVLLNRVMLELMPDYDSSDARELASEIGGEVVFEFRTFPGYLVEFRADTLEDLEKALAVLEADYRVAAAFPDLLLSADDEHEKGRTANNRSVETLNLTRDRRKGAYLTAGMQSAWETMGLVDKLEPVSIAIIDSGFVSQTGDKEIDAVLNAEFDYERIQFPFGKGNWWGNLLGHGTKVASVILAQNNVGSDDPRSFSGVLTSVDEIEYSAIVYSTPLGFRHSGARITSALEDLILYKNQIDVVNISKGVRCDIINRVVCVGVPLLPAKWFKPWRSHWLRLMRAMPNVVFVFAAGNSESDAQGLIPADFALELPNAITVGATHQGNRAYFSNFGPAVTLGAPGQDVWVVDRHRGYDYAKGTSFAAPMVSGTVALLKALDSKLSPDDIRRVIVETGDLHRVCTSSKDEVPLDPCPPEDQEQWPFLNAGEAVSSLLWPSVDAEINSQTIQPRDAILGSYVELTVPVKNTGDRPWEFHMAGVTKSPSGTTEDMDSVRHVVREGDSHPFKLGFVADEVGEWTVEVRVYRNAELTSSRDSEELRVQVVLGPAAVPGSTRTDTDTRTLSFTSVSAGRGHTCGLRTDGSVICWDAAWNHNGETTPPVGFFTSVSAGWYHTCGVKTDGSVACWGSNALGQSEPPGGTFSSVSAGGYHTCGVKTSGSVDCWGQEYGYSYYTPYSGSFASVSAYGRGTCGLRPDGSVVCWGSEYGDPPAEPFNSISRGYFHACGVKTDSSIACWGNNGDGQSTPPMGSFTSVSAGGAHTCGVKTDGSIACWGSNADYDYSSDKYVGQATPPEGSFISVSAGYNHTCAVSTDGSVVCWGSNRRGQATPPGGTYVPVPTATPQAVPTTNPVLRPEPATPIQPTPSSEAEPLNDDRVFINGGTLNGQQIDSANPSLSVTPGQSISGSVNLTVENGHGGHAIFPVGATTTWGDHESSYWSLPIHPPAFGSSQGKVTINLTAPSISGVYAIIFAAQAETSLAHVMSGTHWASSRPRWDNGDDIAGWDASQIDFAIGNGYVRAPQYGWKQPTAHFGASAMKIVVSGGR